MVILLLFAVFDGDREVVGHIITVLYIQTHLFAATTAGMRAQEALNNAAALPVSPALLFPYTTTSLPYTCSCENLHKHWSGLLPHNYVNVAEVISICFSLSSMLFYQHS